MELPEFFPIWELAIILYCINNWLYAIRQSVVSVFLISEYEQN